MQFKWSASEQCRPGSGLYYAIRRTSGAGGAKREKVWLHREIALRMWGTIPEGHVPDHGKGGTLDCTRENLTLRTAQENKERALRQGWYNRMVDEPCL